MSFQHFLSSFVPKLQRKEKQAHLASWILETIGSEDAAKLKADITTEYHLLLNDKKLFEELKAWDKDPLLTDPILKRELNILIRAFTPNQIDKELLEEMSTIEAHLSLLYSNFRPTLEEKTLSENDIRSILKTEKDPAKRKAAWEASKQIGTILAPDMLKLISLRNDAAKSLGFDNYFSMQLSLQEVNEEELFKLLDRFAKDSDAAYSSVLNEIETEHKNEFGDTGPWAWSEPFCQEDPLNLKELDHIVDNVDIIETARVFYDNMGLNVDTILQRSDNFERSQKNQHAFCTHIDREGDIRVLNNVKPTIKWLEVVLHELGHAVYELGLSPKLPWLLKEPPHMITTEAMALIAGRQAYRAQSLKTLSSKSDKALQTLAETSLKRRQLIFSRWALVMTYFERELYRNPEQDLNKLWWKMVETYQKIKSTGSAHKYDFAAKYHISLAPAYYFSYLLGEFFASALEEKIDTFSSKKTGAFLNEKLFFPGNRFHWNELICHATGSPLTEKAWIAQFT